MWLPGEHPARGIYGLATFYVFDKENRHNA
jgi:hypothetical protein